VTPICAGHTYVRVGTRAAEAIAQNPEKPNRGIAAELGVSREAVRKARGTAHRPGMRRGSTVS
jgi:hypothetical protein